MSVQYSVTSCSLSLFDSRRASLLANSSAIVRTTIQVHNRDYAA